jgi:hypothetical protein
MYIETILPGPKPYSLRNDFVSKILLPWATIAVVDRPKQVARNSKSFVKSKAMFSSRISSFRPRFM